MDTRALLLGLALGACTTDTTKATDTDSGAGVDTDTCPAGGCDTADTDAAATGSTPLPDVDGVVPDTTRVLSGEPVLTAEEEARHATNPSTLLATHDVRRDERTVDAPCVLDPAGGSDCLDDGVAAAPSDTPYTGPATLEAEAADFDASTPVNWSSRAAAAELSGVGVALKDDGQAWGPGFAPAPTCVPDISTPTETLYFGSAWKGGMVFLAPNDAFDTDGDGSLVDDPAELAAAKAFLSDVRPHIPFSLAFHDETVSLGSGWFYDGGSSHRGLDYGSSGRTAGQDPGFEVLATADGIVRRVMTMNTGGGNTVIIEHPRADGRSLWSLYMHLRNGKSADQAAALTMTAGKSSDTCVKYRKFILNSDYDDHPAWGTEAQTIRVKEGDKVRRGDLIGWAGNTGCGGIGAGLDADGIPGDPIQANTHLHMYYAMTMPGVTVSNTDGTTSQAAVYVDAYGAYEKADARGCYDLGTETPYARLLAPFDPMYTDVPPQILGQYLGYYTQMAYGPRSVSTTYVGGEARTAGVFGPMAPGTWAMLVNMDEAYLEGAKTTYAGLGLRLDQLQVAYAGDAPRWAAIFRKKGAGEASTHDLSLAEGGYVQSWQTYVSSGDAMLLDYDRYEVAGTPRVSALYLQPPEPFSFFRDQPRLKMAQLVDDQDDKGFRPLHLSVSPDDDLYSVVYVKDDRTYFYASGIRAVAVRLVDATLRKAGYRPDQLVAYETNDETLYAGTWFLPSGPKLAKGFTLK